MYNYDIRLLYPRTKSKLTYHKRIYNLFLLCMFKKKIINYLFDNFVVRPIIIIINYLCRWPAVIFPLLPSASLTDCQSQRTKYVKNGNNCLCHVSIFIISYMYVGTYFERTFAPPYLLIYYIQKYNIL